ncbi:predicted protein [Sclerotinia sclerotiorum 1980 UF-70]|uniref:Uncharacterized protein n=1 Tax=Sclerotinia sclerotiorum (strain ATCC 18683 / 1980 / Ss-1) TaxID=665079 RepID=A7ETF7_SCLS1|nr:predicted protein [Sclerotinia sclerotiorum 1980 UF-70]EDN92749.1 predicted protein [Sclerotinia sclerotiorum 1980 UF-70]
MLGPDTTPMWRRFLSKESARDRQTFYESEALRRWNEINQGPFNDEQVPGGKMCDQQRELNRTSEKTVQ